MNLQVCQKDREPTVITINHREIIKEWAGALRLAEACGWKGLLDVLGCSSKEPALGVFLICLFQHWGSAVRWLFKSIHEYKSQMKLSSSVFSHFMHVNSPVLWPRELTAFHFGGRHSGRVVFCSLFLCIAVTQPFAYFISFISQRQHF